MRRQFACMCNVLLIITVGSTFSFMWWWVYSTDCACIYMELGHSFSWHKQFSLMMTADFHLKTTTKKGSGKKRRQSKFIYVAPLRYKAVQSTLQSQGNTSEIMIIKWIIKHIQNKIYEKKNLQKLSEVDPCYQAWGLLTHPERKLFKSPFNYLKKRNGISDHQSVKPRI